MLSPKVSILMPCYNVEKYIAEAIESMLNQTFNDFELILLDDGSTDKTAEIINRFEDDRIVYRKNEQNLGLAENLNLGIRLARGEYIARMDGDDIALPQQLEKQLAVLEKYPEIGICGACFQFFGTKKSKVFYPETHEAIKAQMLFGCPVIIPVYRRKVILDNNLWYKTSAFPAEDYMFWAECLRVTKIYNVQEILFYYRMHPSQISTEKREAQIQKTNEVRLFMLDYLNPDFTVDEKRFFLHNFIPFKIKRTADVKQLKSFAKKLEQKNSECGNFDSKILHKKLQSHIKISMYGFVLETFFEREYNLRSYFRYLKTGGIFDVPYKQNVKILAKSILNKKR